jgi:hypothetical protein
MKVPAKWPLPTNCTYSHFQAASQVAHFCHVQWIDPGDDVPWNVTVEWYGLLVDLNILMLERQGFLKLLEFIRTERAKDEPQS